MVTMTETVVVVVVTQWNQPAVAGSGRFDLVWAVLIGTERKSLCLDSLLFDDDDDDDHHHHPHEDDCFEPHEKYENGPRIDEGFAVQ